MSDENSDVFTTPFSSPRKMNGDLTSRQSFSGLRSSPLSVRNKGALATRTAVKPPLMSSRATTSLRPPLAPSTNSTGLVADPLGIVVIGDPKCGKSSLILTYLAQRHTKPVDMSPFETYDKLIHFNNSKSVKLQVWDFPGDEYFDRFRPLGYANAKGVIICFDLSKIGSLQSVKVRWIPEVETHCPNAKKLLVGIGSELRLDLKMNKLIPTQLYCQQHASQFGCEYMECSLSNNRSYSKVFEAMLMSLNHDKKKGHLGTLLEISKTRLNTMSELKQQLGSPSRRTSYKKKTTKISRCSVM